jgi:hypothetical protein
VVSKAIRERGNSTAAALFDKASVFGAVEKQAQALDKAIDEAVARFFGKGKAPVASASKRTNVVKEYERAVQQVANASADKARTQAAVLAKTSPLTEHAPELQAAVARTSLRALAYLESHIPAGRVEGPSATPHLDTPHVSEWEQHMFLDRVRTVEDPRTALRDFAAGRASREQIDALKHVYPKLYAQLVAKVYDELSTAKTHLPYQKILQLSAVLGQPLDPSLNPAFIAAVGKADTTPPQGKRPPPMASGPPFKTTSMIATTTQRVEGLR